jgi:hypothetical protein
MRVAGVRASDVLLALAVIAGMVFAALLGRSPAGGFDTFASSDFRSGGYAAWFALLQREGLATQAFEQRPAELDARIDTLIAATPTLPAETGSRDAADQAALAHWVASGGRLIALGAGDAFRSTGSRVSGIRPPTVDARSPGGRLRGPLAASVAQLAGLSAQRFQLARGSSAGVLLADRSGPVVLRVPYGRGAIDFVSDPHLFDNGWIAHADNARLAFALARPRASGAVAFDETLHGVLIERTWWQAIDVPERTALAGIAIAILLALAGGALRLGPPIALREVREPASDEFVAAVAALYQRNKARRAAIALLAAGAQSAHGAAADELRRLAERQSPVDRDLIASAVLARAIREGA